MLYPDCGIKVHTLFSQMTKRIDYIVLVAHYELQIHVSSKFYRSSPLAILFMREYFQGGSSDGPVAGIKRIHGTELAEV